MPKRIDEQEAEDEQGKLSRSAKFYRPPINQQKTEKQLENERKMADDFKNIPVMKK